jgi:hypothetical protein
MKTGDTREGAFSAARFRDGVGFAMKMGIADTLSERVTFFWTTENTYAVADTKAAPYDWTAVPDTTKSATDVPASLTVPVAVEFFDSKSSSGDTAIGDFDIGRIKVTMLDTSYDQLDDFYLGKPTGMTVDGDTYIIDYWAPPIGLFDVTIYSVFASARDES